MIEGSKNIRLTEGIYNQFQAKVLNTNRYDRFSINGSTQNLVERVLHLQRGEKAFAVYAIQREGESEANPDIVPIFELPDATDISFQIFQSDVDRPIASIWGSLVGLPEEKIYYVTETCNYSRQDGGNDSQGEHIKGIVGQTAAALVRDEIVDIWISSPADTEDLSASAKSMYDQLEKQASKLGIIVDKVNNRYEIVKGE